MLLLPQPQQVTQTAGTLPDTTAGPVKRTARRALWAVWLEHVRLPSASGSARCCLAVARPCQRCLSSHYQRLQHVACVLAFPGLSNPNRYMQAHCLPGARPSQEVFEHQGHHFRCPIQDQNGLRCTYCHYDALEMGRHLKDGHTGRCVSNKWKYTFCYFGIVTEVGLVLACSPSQEVFEQRILGTTPNKHACLWCLRCSPGPLSCQA